MKQVSLYQKLRHFIKHSKLILNNFSVMPRVVRGYFRTLILKKNTLRTLELTVTPECNVNCEMCYATKIHQKGQEYLTPAEYKDLWKQAKKMGAFSVVISGGEPTMRSDLFEIIAALEPGKTLIGIVSNSTRLNKDYLQKLFDAGVSVLHLSLNSVDEEQNDKQRDYDGHFKRVNEVVDMAKEIGFQVLFSTVVAHDGMENTKAVVEFAKKRGVGVVFFHLLVPQVIGRELLIVCLPPLRSGMKQILI